MENGLRANEDTQFKVTIYSIYGTLSAICCYIHMGGKLRQRYGEQESALQSDSYLHTVV